MSSNKILFRHDDPHGHGDVHFVWQTGAAPTYLCSTGTDGTVAIFNRQGILQDRLILQSLCCGLAWDTDGDVLAILTLNSSQIIIWDSNSQKKQIIDSGLRDNLSCLIWSKRLPILAVGTARGNLTIYNHQTTKRIPIIGKHSKKILCGAWSTESILALGSDDRSLSLSNEEGDTLKIVSLRDTPSDMYFAEMKTDERLPGENTISMILGRRTLFLYHLHEPDSPTELGFQNRYGPLVQHKWFGDGYILLGFGNGFIVSISTHPKEVGQELWQVKNHRDALTGIAICQELELIASCGDNNIKIHSMSNLQETRTILNLSEQTGVKSIEWSFDGQLLAASTAQGSICVFITKLFSLSAVCPPRIAILSSLAEVTLYQFILDKIQTQQNELNLEIEPSFLGVGPQHLACGMNNHVWFYDLGHSLSDSPLLLGDREYMNEIKKVELNTNYAAVLSGGHILLHPIDGQITDRENLEPKLFPDELIGMEESLITCFGLTAHFLAFATDLGHIVYFSIENWGIITQYRHTMGIKEIYLDFDGAKAVIIDDHNQGYVYIPTTREIILIPDFSKTCKGVVWDVVQPNCFIAFDSKTCAVYIYIHHSIKGKHIEKVGETTIVSDQIPLMMHDGEICISVSDGKLSTIRLTTHYYSGVDQREELNNLKTLRKYEEAWKICRVLEDKDLCIDLGNSAIEDLNVEFAVKVFRSLGDAGMVFALEQLLNIEDVNLLSGHCALLLEHIDEAKTFFSESVNPQEALRLCRDLLQSEQAIALATSLAPEQVPFIAKEYAQQLEFTGNFSEALINYEKGLHNDIIYNNGLDLSENITDHIIACKSGIARMSIKTGDYRKGIKLAEEMNDKQLYSDCAELLVASGNYAEAASLYEKSDNWDKACELYIQQKLWNRAEEILSNVTSLKLHIAYAKAKESEGRFPEAINSYTIAGDMDNVVRIYLDYLSDPHSAGEIVIQTKSVDGAKMLARFFQQIGDYESTLQYLVLCGCITEAFSLAEKHNKLKFYAELLEQSDATKATDFIILAQYFENEKYTLLAGKYYFLGKEFSKALKHLLKAAAFSNEENTALSLAVDCVATSNDEKLVTELIEYLLGESDGVPKDPKLLFRLYMARKQYKEAAKTAVIIANQEQVNGNYKIAHELLFSLYQELRRNQLTIAADLRYNLILLHRYMLVRIHMKLGNHLLAARLLVQVAENISQFPSHIVPILTSTVIECQRAGLKKSAFSYAVMLMRPEFRNQIDVKYAKKIEAFVRKAPRDIKNLEDDNTDTSECPVCETNFPSMAITCTHCKTTLPICIATGQHIIKKNLAVCPECNFLCMKSEMAKIVDALSSCPMCGESVDSNRLTEIIDLNQYISMV